MKLLPQFTIFSLCTISLLACSLSAFAQQTDANTAALPASRPFYMGFSDWNFGDTQAHQAKTYDLIWKHSDLICFQFMDGVPWPEAYAGEPFGKALQKMIDDRLAALKEGHKVYLEISLLSMYRNTIAGYIGDELGPIPGGGGLPRPAPWDTYGIEDEQIATAYANYCIRLIETFKPAYVNYVLEGANFGMHSPEVRATYLQLLDKVYSRIKAAHPETPLGISATIHNPERAASQEYKAAIARLLPYVDWLGASFYPFAFYRREGQGNPNTLPERSITLIQDLAQDKPVAFTETNWPAENLVIEDMGLNVEINPQWQKDFTRDLLQAAYEVDALFVVWWSIADFDIKWASFIEEVKDIGLVWRDTGLYDQDLKPRPALDVWHAWCALPVEPEAK